MSEPTPVSVDPTDARKAARNAAALAVASIASKGALFIWQLVLARLLTQSGVGIYGTIGGMMVIAATLPEFGMGLIVLRDVAQKRDQAGKMLSATLVMQPLLAVLAYGGLILSGMLLGYDDSIRSLLPLAGLSLFVDAMGNMVHNQLLAREQMVVPSIISVSHIFLLIGLVAIALFGGMGLVGLYWATIAASGIRAIAYWVTLVRSGVGTDWPLDRAVMWGLLVNGAPLAVNSLMGTAYQHADKIITTALIGEANTALLLVSFVIVAGVVELLNSTVMIAIFPMMSRHYGTGQREAFDFLVTKIAFLTLLVGIPIGVITSLFALDIVLIFGPAYASARDVLAVLIWYGVITMVANVFAQVLMIQNRQTRLLVVRAGGLTFNILMTMLLLPRIGAPGAAVSSVIAELVVMAVLQRQWDGGGIVLSGLRTRLMRMVLAGLVMMGLTAVLRLLLPPSTGLANLAILAAGGVGGALVYAAAVWRLNVIAPDDWGFIRQVLISMPGGSLVERVWHRA